MYSLHLLLFLLGKRCIEELTTTGTPTGRTTHVVHMMIATYAHIAATGTGTELVHLIPSFMDIVADPITHIPGRGIMNWEQDARKTELKAEKWRETRGTRNLENLVIYTIFLQCLTIIWNVFKTIKKYSYCSIVQIFSVCIRNLSILILRCRKSILKHICISWRRLRTYKQTHYCLQWWINIYI